MALRQKALLWPPLGTQTLQDTLWFAESIHARQDIPSTDEITVSLDQQAFVEMLIFFNGIVRIVLLNDNKQIQNFEFGYAFQPGMTYNFRHTSNGTREVIAIVSTTVVE